MKKKKIISKLRTKYTQLSYLRFKINNIVQTPGEKKCFEFHFFFFSYDIIRW